MIKALVATKETQGLRKSDFDYVDDGELLVFAPQCNDTNPDSSCGCRRSLLGIFSRRATTTFTVKQVNLTPTQFVDIMYQFHKEFQNVDEPTLKQFAERDANLVLRTAEAFDCGAVLERRNDIISARRGAEK